MKAEKKEENKIAAKKLKKNTVTKQKEAEKSDEEKQMSSICNVEPGEIEEVKDLFVHCSDEKCLKKIRLGGWLMHKSRDHPAISVEYTFCLDTALNPCYKCLVYKSKLINKIVPNKFVLIIQ